MKRVLAILMALSILMSAVLAVDTGAGVGINIETEDFPPMIWMCDQRIVRDDNVETGRVSAGGQELLERTKNYAFEGEQISWKVLVLDKNGYEKIKDVYVSVGPVQGNGEYIEANCVLDHVLPYNESISSSCNARIQEEEITHALADNIMAYYTCTLTVESPASMHGEYWITASIVDLDGLLGTMAENEYWFLNPVVALTIGGTPLNFGIVRPGTVAYSNTLKVGNGAETGSGVMMDMFVSGTDFTDPSHSGAKCPTTNQLSLKNFRYFATNGAYATQNDQHVNSGGAVTRNKDAEGYVNIEYGNYFSRALYNDAEIIQSPAMDGLYYRGNILSPGSEMSVTLKLALPLPCNGDFSDGKIFFWGEAI